MSLSSCFWFLFLFDFDFFSSDLILWFMFLDLPNCDNAIFILFYFYIDPLDDLQVNDPRRCVVCEDEAVLCVCQWSFVYHDFHLFVLFLVC